MIAVIEGNLTIKQKEVVKSARVHGTTKRKKPVNPVQKSEITEKKAIVIMRTSAGSIMYQDFLNPEMLRCVVHSPYPALKQSDTNVGSGTYCTHCGVSGVYLSEQTIDWHKL